MKKDIIFTTETDGLVKHQVVSDKYIHLFPHMLQISLQDEDGAQPTKILIDNNIEIKEHITKINGIDNKLIAKHGVNPLAAIALIRLHINDGDCLVSHNVDFHLKVLKAFYYRNGVKFPEVSTKCVQSSLIDTVRVPFDAEDLEKGFKKPSLDHLKEYYNIDKDMPKIESLFKVYGAAKELLVEQREVKPASF
jgi:DNA polymerase III epsilon subunit-like protein